METTYLYIPLSLNHTGKNPAPQPHRQSSSSSNKENQSGSSKQQKDHSSGVGPVGGRGPQRVQQSGHQSGVVPLTGLGSNRENQSGSSGKQRDHPSGVGHVDGRGPQRDHLSGVGPVGGDGLILHSIVNPLLSELQQHYTHHWPGPEIHDSIEELRNAFELSERSSPGMIEHLIHLIFTQLHPTGSEDQVNLYLDRLTKK